MPQTINKLTSVGCASNLQLYLHPLSFHISSNTINQLISYFVILTNLLVTLNYYQTILLFLNIYIKNDMYVTSRFFNHNFIFISFK